METIYITTESGVITGVYTTTQKHDVDVQIVDLDDDPTATVPEGTHQVY